MKPNELIIQLIKLDSDKDILCQVVANDGSAWNMSFTFEHTAARPVFRVTHPQLETLPKEIETEDQRRIMHIDVGRDVTDKDIEQIIQMFKQNLHVNLERTDSGNILKGYSIVSNAGG